MEERTAGRLVLLVIDEAQNLGLPALEEIRMLSNLETEKSKLIQIVLVGQPNLREQLDLPRLEQLRQRITVSYHLKALDADETEAYINHRLRRAALGAPLQLRRDVTDRVHRRARGVPRLVNVICDAALVFAYAEERRTIDAPLMDEVFLELEETGVLRPLAAAAPAQPAVTEARPVEHRVAEAPARAPVEGAVGMAAAEAEPAERPPAASPTREVAQVVAAAPPAPRPADGQRDRELLAHESLLTAREEEIARRERHLAEQQRVLAEEYRLFRARHARDLARATLDAPGRATAPPRTSAPWSPLAGQAQQAAASRPPAAHGARLTTRWTPPPVRPTFWRRMKNLLLGLPAAAVEDRR